MKFYIVKNLNGVSDVKRATAIQTGETAVMTTETLISGREISETEYLSYDVGAVTKESVDPIVELREMIEELALAVLQSDGAVANV